MAVRGWDRRLSLPLSLSSVCVCFRISSWVSPRDSDQRPSGLAADRGGEASRLRRLDRTGDPVAEAGQEAVAATTGGTGGEKEGKGGRPETPCCISR